MQKKKIFILVIAILFCLLIIGTSYAYFGAFGQSNVQNYSVGDFSFTSVSYTHLYYGEVMLNAIYYLPLQFIGYYLWSKNTNLEDEKVNGKKLNIKQSVILLIVTGLSLIHI